MRRMLLLVLLLLLLLLKVVLWRCLSQHQILASILVRTMRMTWRIAATISQTLMMLLQKLMLLLLLLLLLLLKCGKVGICAAIGLRQLLLYGLSQRGGSAISSHFSPIHGIGIIHGLTLQIQTNATGGHMLLQITHRRRMALLLFLCLLGVLLQMLLQIGLLRVGLAAQLANVRLEML